MERITDLPMNMQMDKNEGATKIILEMLHKGPFLVG
jgi:hypothetical protein